MVEQTRWMITIHCEFCGFSLERSIQDIVKLAIGKHSDKCPKCRRKIAYKEGLLPSDIS